MRLMSHPQGFVPEGQCVEYDMNTDTNVTLYIRHVRVLNCDISKQHKKTGTQGDAKIETTQTSEKWYAAEIVN